MKYTKKTTWELYAKTVRMRAAEKRALRERLVSYIAYHPVRVPLREVSSLTPQVMVSERFATLRFSAWQFKVFAGSLAVILLVGIPLYAERAVPGDMLYAMKVRVNEEVRASLTWNSAERVAWQTARVERRVAEARLLAKEGKLTDETEADLAQTVREHTETASREIASLRTTDAEGAAVAQATLSSALDVQTVILATEAASTTASTSISTLAETVKEVQIGVGAHDPVLDANLSPEKLDALLEFETTRARELFISVGASVSDTERIDIERRLVDAERAVSDARLMYQTGRHDEALNAQRVIFGNIEKLISFMSDVSIRDSVSIESLVPKQSTQEERTAALSVQLENLKRDFVSVRRGRVSVIDKATLVKYDAGLQKVDVLLGVIEASRSNGSDAEESIVEAKALIADLTQLRTQPSATTSITTDEISAGTSSTPIDTTLSSTTNASTTDVGSSTSVR